MEESVVLVCGYGCHLTPEIKEYLNNIASHFAKGPSSLVITSGGFTNQETAKGVSEAGMMKDYLVKCGVNPGLIYKDEKAITTTGNLVFGKEIIDDIFFKEPKVIIWCDSIRAFKVRYQAKRIFNDPIVKGYDFNRSWKEKLKQWFIATPFEILSFHLMFLLYFKKSIRKYVNSNR